MVKEIKKKEVHQVRILRKFTGWDEFTYYVDDADSYEEAARKVKNLIKQDEEVLYEATIECLFDCQTYVSGIELYNPDGSYEILQEE